MVLDFEAFFEDLPDLLPHCARLAANIDAPQRKEGPNITADQQKSPDINQPVKDCFTPNRCSRSTGQE
jgi:hypothetical protein